MFWDATFLPNAPFVEFSEPSISLGPLTLDEITVDVPHLMSLKARDIKLDRNYNFEFVCFRITGFRPDNAPIVKISGENLRHDLHCFIEDLSDSANVSAEEFGQPVHTVEELSKMFNVSTKTISRWRQQGLVSRKFIFGGGRNAE